MVPGKTSQLTPIARKRLEVLNRFSDLGAGFKVAQHDLELRGAGTCWGETNTGTWLQWATICTRSFSKKRWRI